MSRNNKSINSLLAITLACSGTQVCAENWFIRDGTEQTRDDKMYFVGLVQPTFQYDDSDRVSGLGGPLSGFNGDHTTLSKIGPSYDSTQSFYLFRVRFGARGTVLPDINYEFVGEYGANALTTIPGENANVELAEGSITLNKIPGMRIRTGIFKVPGPEESLRYAIEYVNFTQATQFLVNTQPYRKVSDVDGTRFIAEPRSGVRAFRDTGVQAFDAFRFGNLEYTYAVMAGNGNTLNKTDDNDKLSLYGRVQASYLFDDAHPMQRTRSDATVFAWKQEDNLTFDDTDYSLNKFGFGTTFTKGRWQFNAEYMRADGMLYLSPLFSDQAGGTLFPSKHNHAEGAYVDLGAFVGKNWLFGIRYDVLSQRPEDKALEREFRTTTLAAQYYFSKKVRLAFNYEFRSYDYGKKSRMSAQDAANINEIENAIGDRIAIQLTAKL